ncbi:leucine rich repeat containing protein 40 [Echinococcus multilocularis]|uniref:Leucine rich repeat containing protein 40 n=1 Tax=Echinococcus multilocularis TaxID=6211 RepID=A0A068YFQ0_ECHMU|nr:leucine rich repeat containing protein 40 [Echinococcus multilocularis]
MFRAPLHARAENSDPHNIHEKTLLAARRSGVISLNGRGLSYVPPVIWTLNKHFSEEKPISFESAGADDIKWWEAEPITRLNLFGNSIKELPGDGISQLDSLVNIDIRDNELTGLPEEVAALVNLKQLLLSSNQISTLPKTFTQLTTLVLLDLAHNRLTALPDDLKSLTALEKLDVSDNQLSQVSSSLPPALFSLNLSRNRLIRLPQGWIQSCPVLREFNASDNDLDDVGITEDPKLLTLTILTLHKNHLCTIPPLRAFPRLKDVSLGDNRIDSFNLEPFQGLYDLATLELSRNRIAAVPDGIPKALPALARLDLSSNKIKSIPTELGFMESLNVLVLGANPFRSLGLNVINSGTEAIKALLRERHRPEGVQVPKKESSTAPCDNETAVSTNPYDHLPVVVAGSGVLDWGRRGKKQTCGHRFGAPTEDENDKLPPLDDQEVWRAVALRGRDVDVAVKKIILSNHGIETFPKGIMAFQDSLAVLDLSYNKLSQLPNEISCLPRLEILSLSNNVLTSLPMSLSKLSALATLVLDFNPGLGPELPLEILFVEPICRSLQEISARSCRLTRLPPASVISVDRMPQLRTLNVSDNDIGALEPELGRCTQIQNLHVTGNTFRVPRPAIVAKGTATILEYLRSRIAE